MSVNKAHVQYLKKFLTTDGRLSRSSYWAYHGVFYAFCIIFGGIDEQFGMPEWFKTVIGIGVILLLLVGIIVQIKRWHDLNKSGWWVLINFICCIGPIWSIIECGCIQGTKGENRFGPDPLETQPSHTNGIA
jgi:uncharacterized membrane protein YhaH (DUF805 family)